MASEGEECESDEGFGAVESECDAGEEPDLGVGGRECCFRCVDRVNLSRRGELWERPTGSATAAGQRRGRRSSRQPGKVYGEAAWAVSIPISRWLAVSNAGRPIASNWGQASSGSHEK